MNFDMNFKKALFSSLMALTALTGMTQDGWSPLSSGTSENINGIFFTSATTGYAVGNDGVALKTSNGSSWSPMSLVTPNSLNTVYFEESSVGYIGDQNGRIYRTVNSGGSWTPNSISSGGINGIDFSSGNGVAVGDNGSVHTTTDGVSWSSVGSLTVFALNDVAFLNDSVVAAVGSGGNVYKSTDSGANWSMIATGVSGALSSITKYSNTEYLIAGTDGMVLRFNPTTESFVIEAVALSSEWLKSIDCSPTGVCYAGGTNSTLLLRHSGSGNWVDRSLDSTININTLHFPTGLIGFVGGISGKISRTDYGGFQVSTENIEENKTPEVLPNPFLNTVTISNYSGNYEVYNSLGIQTALGTSDGTPIDLGHLTPGLYFVNLIGSSKTLRVIKQ